MLHCCCRKFTRVASHLSTLLNIKSQYIMTTMVRGNNLSTTSRDEPEFFDLLTRLRNTGDLAWALEDKKYAHGSKRPILDLHQSVLTSTRVQNAIFEYSQQSNRTIPQVEKQTKDILNVITHQFSLSVVRGVAYVMKKIVQRIWSHLYVNESHVKQFQSSSMQSKLPMLFLPTHRTYMDFILVTFMCYEYDLPLPAIAAAMDFMSMRGVCEVLRRCGAFFIRRGKADDDDVLYWAVLETFCEEHLIHNDRPIEFFVEGTRSRTGKSLHPKYGLLSLLIEPYLKRQIFDVLVCPVSITYSKLLEEKLYAFELMGIPKPKESTSGLMKARSILDTDYGDVFVRFCEPISLRKFVDDNFSDCQILTNEMRRLAIQPISMRMTTTESMKNVAKHLSRELVDVQQKNLVIGVWPVACFILNALSLTRNLISNDEMVHILLQLCRFIDDLGCKIWLENREISPKSLQAAELERLVRSDLARVMKIHSNLVELYPNGRIEVVSSVEQGPGVSSGSDVIVRCAPWMMISKYANQCSHLLSTPCILAVVIRDLASMGNVFDVDDAKTRFARLEELLGREYLVLPGQQHQQLRFTKSLSAMAEAEIIKMTSDNEQVTVCGGGDMLQLFCSMLDPILLGYDSVFETILNHQSHLITEKQWINLTSVSAYNIVKKGVSNKGLNSNVQIMSNDLQKNALHTLRDMKIVGKDRKNQTFSLINRVKLTEITKQLQRQVSGNISDQMSKL